MDVVLLNEYLENLLETKSVVEGHLKVIDGVNFLHVCKLQLTFSDYRDRKLAARYWLGYLSGIEKGITTIEKLILSASNEVI